MMKKAILISLAATVCALFVACSGDSGGNQMTLTLFPQEEVRIKLSGAGAVAVDWGDGSAVETIDAPQFVEEEKMHTYSDEFKEYTIRITGGNVTEMRCHDSHLTGLDVSKNPALTVLECSNNDIKSLNVSKNTALARLDCSLNELASLDVGKNIALTELDCASNGLESIDVSKNTALTVLSCGGNELTSLNVDKNAALKTILCYTNRLSADALNALFSSLHGNEVKNKSVDITNNPGTDDCNRDIAAGKGWGFR